MPVDYIPLNIGIDFGSDYLTNEVAYFLGGILAANEHTINNGQTFWIAPFRSNPGYATVTQIEMHYNHVQNINRNLHGYVYMRDNIKSAGLDSGKFFRMQGFGAFFGSRNCDSLEPVIPEIKQALIQSSPAVRRCFVVGAFDGRGSVDLNRQNNKIRYLVLDCPNNTTGMLLHDLLVSEGFSVNYNLARDRVEGGEPRKPQLRIKNWDKFLKCYGMVSEKKYDVMKSSYTTTFGGCLTRDESSVLDGLKTIE